MIRRGCQDESCSPMNSFETTSHALIISDPATKSGDAEEIIIVSRQVILDNAHKTIVNAQTSDLTPRRRGMALISQATRKMMRLPSGGSVAAMDR